jgi:hypothetical protein
MEKRRPAPRKTTLQQNVRVKKMKLGRGVFAARRLRRSQNIGEILGEVIDDPKYTSEYCIDLGGSRNLEPEPPFRFLNHSCEPNCELFSWEPREGEDPSVADRMFVGALKTIEPGEELTIDYGWPADAAIRCRCGSGACRGWVVSMEELPTVLRRQKRKKSKASSQRRAKSATRGGE